jgi:hypothetical protein
MRPLIALLLSFPVLGATARADEVSFLRVWPQWHSADSFQSFYEYRRHRELDGKFTVLRSIPEDRGGLYFLTRVENRGAALHETVFVVSVIEPNSTETRIFTFPAGIPAGSQLFEIGLTGDDWPGPKAMPLAWTVELRTSDGQVLAEKSSFLWRKPPGS